MTAYLLTADWIPKRRWRDLTRCATTSVTETTASDDQRDSAGAAVASKVDPCRVRTVTHRVPFAAETLVLLVMGVVLVLAFRCAASLCVLSGFARIEGRRRGNEQHSLKSFTHHGLRKVLGGPEGACKSNIRRGRK